MKRPARALSGSRRSPACRGLRPACAMRNFQMQTQAQQTEGGRALDEGSALTQVGW